jgi:hypothetical protein
MSNSRNTFCLDAAELGFECIKDSATKWKSCDSASDVGEAATTVPFRIMGCGIGLVILGLFGTCGATEKAIRMAKNSDCTRSAPAQQSMDDSVTAHTKYTSL